MIQTDTDRLDHPLPHGGHGAATDSIPLSSKLNVPILVDKELGVFVAPTIPFEELLPAKRFFKNVV